MMMSTPSSGVASSGTRRTARPQPHAVTVAALCLPTSLVDCICLFLCADDVMQLASTCSLLRFQCGCGPEQGFFSRSGSGHQFWWKQLSTLAGRHIASDSKRNPYRLYLTSKFVSRSARAIQPDWEHFSQREHPIAVRFPAQLWFVLDRIPDKALLGITCNSDSQSSVTDPMHFVVPESVMKNILHENAVSFCIGIGVDDWLYPGWMENAFGQQNYMQAEQPATVQTRRLLQKEENVKQLFYAVIIILCSIFIMYAMK
jgi:hypothetical protein